MNTAGNYGDDPLTFFKAPFGFPIQIVVSDDLLSSNLK